MLDRPGIRCYKETFYRHICSVGLLRRFLSCSNPLLVQRSTAQASFQFRSGRSAGRVPPPPALRAVGRSAIAEHHAPTATLTGLSNPDALAFDSSGNLYVANNGDGNGDIGAGATVSNLAGNARHGHSHWAVLIPSRWRSTPAATCMWPTTYSGNNTVSEFAGKHHPYRHATGLNSPIALAFDSSGNLYVADYGAVPR